MAGAVGVDPRPFTWWQLEMMANGKARTEWAMMSSLMALIASIFSKKPVRPCEFDPTYIAPKKTPEVIAAEVADHKQQFKRLQKHG